MKVAEMRIRVAITDLTNSHLLSLSSSLPYIWSKLLESALWCVCAKDKICNQLNNQSSVVNTIYNMLLRDGNLHWTWYNIINIVRLDWPNCWFSLAASHLCTTLTTPFPSIFTQRAVLVNTTLSFTTATGRHWTRNYTYCYPSKT